MFPSSRAAEGFLGTRNHRRSCARLGTSSSTICSRIVRVGLSRLRPLTTYPRSPSGIGPVGRLRNGGVSRIYVNSYAGSDCLSLVEITRVLGNGGITSGMSLTVTPNSGRMFGVLTLGNTLNSVVTTNTEVLRDTYNPYVNVKRSPGDNNVSLEAFGHGFRNEDKATSNRVCLMSPRATTISTVGNMFASPEYLNTTTRVRVPRGFLVGSGVIVSPTPIRRVSDMRVLHNPGVGDCPRARPLASSVRTSYSLGINSGVAASRVVPTNTGVLPLHSGVPGVSRRYFAMYSGRFPAHTGALNGDVVINNRGCNRNSSHRRTTLTPLFLNIGTMLMGDFTEVRGDGLVGTKVLPLAFMGTRSCSGVGLNSVLRLPGIGSRVTGNGRIAIMGGAANSAVITSYRLSSEAEGVVVTNNLLSCAGRGD